MVWVHSWTGYVVSTSRRLITAGNQVVTGEQVFTSSGTWTAPQGVYSVSVVCIGAGGAGGVGPDSYPTQGGGGGGLGWKNDISVVPFEEYTVNVGNPSYFINTSTVRGDAGEAGPFNNVGFAAGGSYVGDGGFDGGDGAVHSGGQIDRIAGGGGSAADYDANGADGTTGGGDGSGTGVSGNNTGVYGYGGEGGQFGGSGVVQIRYGVGKDFP